MTGAADKPVLTLPDGHFPDDSRRLRTIIIWAIRAMAPTSLARSPDRVRFPNVSTFFMGAPPAPPNGVKLSSDMAEIKEIHSTRRHGGLGEIHGYRVGPSLYFRRGRRVRGAAVLNCLLADELYDIGLRPQTPTAFVAVPQPDRMRGQVVFRVGATRMLSEKAAEKAGRLGGRFGLAPDQGQPPLDLEVGAAPAAPAARAPEHPLPRWPGSADESCGAPLPEWNAEPGPPAPLRSP